MTEYTPVSCAIHSEYELAIMRRSAIMVRWQTPSGDIESWQLHPTDLKTRNGIEYMIATTQNGEIIKIRLDQIMAQNEL